MRDTRAKLILPTSGKESITGYRDVDCRTALTRALAEYLMDTVDVDAIGGRNITFKHVFQSWSEPEQEAKYPSAIVYAQSPGVYDASKFSPSATPKLQLAAPDSRYMLTMAEFVLDLAVEIWCTDPKERMEITNACEHAFLALDNMYGIILELPYYYGLRAVYELKSMQYLDSEEEAMRRYRRAIFILTAQVPIVRLASIPTSKTRLLVKVGTDVVLSNEDC
jgi:hypothetical protein